MIKNIVFDMGNVLIDFDREYFLDSFNVTGEDRDVLLREVFYSTEWAMMDRGTLDEIQMYDIIKTRIPSRLHQKAYDLIFNWDKVVKPIKGVAEYIKELKDRNYKIYLLSNASHRCLDEYWVNVKGHEYFDGLVVSAFINRIKPEKDIYEHLIKKYALNKEECVFIDDSFANVEGAIFYGMKGITFHNDISELRQKLELILK